MAASLLLLLFQSSIIQIINSKIKCSQTQNYHSSFILISRTTTPRYNISGLMKIYNKVALLLLLLTITEMAGAVSDQIKIPLTYAFDSTKKNKLPIELSFNHSYIYSTSPTPDLYLLNFSISVVIRNFLTTPNRSLVQIGLKFPSEFILAISKAYGVNYSSVELGLKPFLQVIIFDDNLMESVDIWKNGGIFSVDVTYNYGSGLVIANKPMELTEGSVIYFQEYLIRQVLHKMSQQNGINYKFIPNTGQIQLLGKLRNLPHLILNFNGYVFKIDLNSKVLHYTPALQNPKRITYVGYRAIKSYNKLAFLNDGQIQFKSTAMVYQLYLFIVYFIGLFGFMFFYLRKNIFDTTLFAKHIFRWVFFKDTHSRREVLKSQLEEQ